MNTAILPIRVDKQRWPQRTEGITVTEVAKIFGVDRRTLSRPIQRIRSGDESAHTTIPEVALAAAIFRKHGAGAVPRVEAGLLIDALGIPESCVAKAPRNQTRASKEVRYRLSKKRVQELYEYPADDVLGVYGHAHGRLCEKNTVNARKWLFAVIEVLLKRGIAVWPDALTRIEGIPYERFRVFATLADWTAGAGPGDVRLFVFMDGRGRPVDFPLAPRRALRGARLVFLDLDGWMKAMRKGLAQERAEAERAAIDGGTGKAKGRGRGHPRA